jgi:predicted AAA+ superfamily ATPase
MRKIHINKNIIKHFPKSIYLDLERPDDLKQLDDAQWFFTANKEKLICIDEVQRKRELFPLIRSLVDEWDRNGCFLVSGSASRDKLGQFSETLAGRISYKFLTPFLFEEISANNTLEDWAAFRAVFWLKMKKLLMNGGRIL